MFLAGAGACALMRWAPVAIAALVLGPLWATGELGASSFSEPRSHLRWDEAMGQAPRPLDGPARARVVAQLASGALGVAVLLLAGTLAAAWRSS